jgi:hypothetical protein
VRIKQEECFARVRLRLPDAKDIPNPVDGDVETRRRQPLHELVPAGAGIYDGCYSVLGGLEVIETLKAAG